MENDSDFVIVPCSLCRAPILISEDHVGSADGWFHARCYGVLHNPEAVPVASDPFKVALLTALGLQKIAGDLSLEFKDSGVLAATVYIMIPRWAWEHACKAVADSK